MNTYINKIRDLLIDCMPIHWYKCYLFFECTESGMSSACYNVKTPSGSIITDGDLLYNCNDEKVKSIKAGTSEKMCIRDRDISGYIKTLVFWKMKMNLIRMYIKKC